MHFSFFSVFAHYLFHFLVSANYKLCCCLSLSTSLYVCSPYCNFIMKILDNILIVSCINVCKCWFMWNSFCLRCIVVKCFHLFVWVGLGLPAYDVRTRYRTNVIFVCGCPFRPIKYISTMVQIIHCM